VGGIEQDMSWLNANDYLVMDSVARDRLDDLRSMSEALGAGEESDDTARAMVGPDRGPCRTFTCGVRSTLRALDELRADR
jgi:hypothetical protein